MKSEIIKLRQKYIDAEIKHFKGTGEKSKSIRAKVSVLDELLNDLSINNRGHLNTEQSKEQGKEMPKSKEDILRKRQAEMSDDLLIEKVEHQISELAKTGGRSHIMCVPPEITDTDMILSELVRRYKEQPQPKESVSELPLDMNKSWATKDVLKTLIWATKHLLDEKSYDGHNHEELNICVNRGNEILSDIDSELYKSNKEEQGSVDVEGIEKQCKDLIDTYNLQKKYLDKNYIYKFDGRDFFDWYIKDSGYVLQQFNKPTVREDKELVEKLVEAVSTYYDGCVGRKEIGMLFTEIISPKEQLTSK